MMKSMRALHARGWRLLAGGDGTATYHFAATGWGRDVIEDSNGRGVITGEGAKKSSHANVWQSADGKLRFILTGPPGGVGDLPIVPSSGDDAITIRNWSAANNLGITLTDAIDAPGTAATYSGDFAKQTESDGITYVVNEWRLAA